MSENISLSSSRIVRYVKDLQKLDEFERITVEEAQGMLLNGTNLKGHLFDSIDGTIPAKLVIPTHKCKNGRVKHAYFAAIASGYSKLSSTIGNKSDFHKRIIDLIVDNYKAGESLYVTPMVKAPKFGDNIDISIEQYINFDRNVTNGGFTIIPDIVIECNAYMIFIEVLVTHQVDEQKKRKYELLSMSDDCERNFAVIEVDLSDLADLYKTNGWLAVEDAVKARCFSNSFEYKKNLFPRTLNISDAPFGLSKNRKPYRLIVNTGADGISQDLRKAIKDLGKRFDSIYISNLDNEFDSWSYVNTDDPYSIAKFLRRDISHGLILVDEDGEKFCPKCPICGRDLRLSLNKSNNFFYLHCEDFQNGLDVDNKKLSDCNFNMTLWNLRGDLSDTFYFEGSLLDILSLGKDAEVVIESYNNMFRK